MEYQPQRNSREESSEGDDPANLSPQVQAQSAEVSITMYIFSSALFDNHIVAHALCQQADF